MYKTHPFPLKMFPVITLHLLLNKYSELPKYGELESSNLFLGIQYALRSDSMLNY